MSSNEPMPTLSEVPPLYPASSGKVVELVTTSRDAPLVENRNQKHPGGASDVKEQLLTIHEELEELRLRRQQLEEKRIRLLAASLPPSRHVSKAEERQPRTASETGERRGGARDGLPQNSTVNDSRRSHPSFSRTSSVTRRHPYAASSTTCRSGNDTFIPSEKTRREHLHDDPYYQLKEAMKKATEKDTMCLIGSFLLEDNSKVYTFGRERRFRPVVGQKGKYYLGTDVEIDQSVNHRQQRSRSAGLARPAYSGTPGPGAYTPRYGKTSKPSILTLYQ